MTTLSIEEIRLPAADIGPVNPLPPIAREADAHARIRPAADVAPEDARYVGHGNVASPLPYLMQDGYSRELRERSFLAVVLDNGRLRGTFLPELGGRLWSLVDLGSGRELLFRNPVFQPANLAIRNAWFAGGIEWNIGLVGHCPFTCSSLFAARLSASDGTPVLRMYEWERVRGVPFQIDALLPAGSPVLLVHVRITNPNDSEVPMYWWSNTAVPETDGTRVIAPADEAYTFAYGGEMRRVPIPVHEGVDRSYPARGRRAADYFFRVPDGTRRWIAAVEADGTGLFQTSTDLLRGRKLFLWGGSSGGRRWQEFLSTPGRAYLEIQSGLARTQAEHLPMPARGSWSWLEAYGPLAIDPASSRSTDWALARSAVESAIERVAPRARLEGVHRELAAVVGSPPSAVFHRGSGWGALESLRARRQRASVPIPEGLEFADATLGPEQAAWTSLLETGRFAAEDEEAAARGVLVARGWWDLLEASVAAGRSEGWLPWYHLGLIRAHHGRHEEAVPAFEESLRARRTPWALRALAVLAGSRGDRALACDLYREALALRPDLEPLAIECGGALIAAGLAREWLDLVGSLPCRVREQGRIRLLVGRAWLESGELAKLEEFLAQPPEIADMREGEVSLSELWFGLHERREVERGGRELDAAGRRRVRLEHPPPQAIDFRMGEDTGGAV
jgi:tetratricopeptide (TPR) repeat protein